MQISLPMAFYSAKYHIFFSNHTNNLNNILHYMVVIPLPSLRRSTLFSFFTPISFYLIQANIIYNIFILANWQNYHNKMSTLIYIYWSFENPRLQGLRHPYVCLRIIVSDLIKYLYCQCDVNILEQPKVPRKHKYSSEIGNEKNKI